MITVHYISINIGPGQERDELRRIQEYLHASIEIYLRRVGEMVSYLLSFFKAQAPWSYTCVAVRHLHNCIRHAMWRGA